MQWETAPDILTVMEAAEILRIGKNRMYELVKSPGFPMFILGTEKGIRIPKNALKNWVDDRVKTIIN